MSHDHADWQCGEPAGPNGEPCTLAAHGPYEHPGPHDWTAIDPASCGCRLCREWLAHDPATCDGCAACDGPCDHCGATSDEPHAGDCPEGP